MAFVNTMSGISNGEDEKKALHVEEKYEPGQEIETFWTSSGDRLPPCVTEGRMEHSQLQTKLERDMGPIDEVRSIAFWIHMGVFWSLSLPIVNFPDYIREKILSMLSWFEQLC